MLILMIMVMMMVMVMVMVMKKGKWGKGRLVATEEQTSLAEVPIVSSLPAL